MSEPTPAPATPSPPSTALARPAGEQFARSLLESFRRGDITGMLSALELTGLEATALARVKTLAQLGIETRRETVTVLGAHEVFVRRTRGGDLHQVIQGVKLSLAEKTLYQLPVKGEPHDPETLKPIPNLKWWYAEQEKAGKRGKKPIWKDAVQTSAEVSFQGFLRLNAVAGCAVGSPATVTVDGVERTNPYVHRADIGSGRLGDIIRVVVGVTVVGPTPATGNPVMVNYVLDYDPAKDLQHMLARVASGQGRGRDYDGDGGGDTSDDCYLLDESEIPQGGDRRPGWKWVPLYGGVGYYCNLRCKAVRDAYAEFTNILALGVRKAQTVATRNAMKRHPALAFHTVEVDTNGRAVVPIVGWAGDQSAMEKWTKLMDRLSRGQTIDVETVHVQETYEAEQHVTGDGESDTSGATSSGLDPEVAAKNRLIENIDGAMALLSPSFVATLGYSPATMSLEELQSCLGKINDHLK